MLLLLEGPNRAVSETLSTMLSQPKQANVMRLDDFHGSVWELYHDGEESLYIGLTTHMSHSRLLKWGLDAHLKKVYGADGLVPEEEWPDMFNEEPNVVLRIEDNDAWRKEVMTKDDRLKLTEFCDKYASLYTQAMVPAYAHHFELFNNEETFNPVKINYRSDEAMYLHSTKDNLAVYLSMKFETDDDLLYGRLFLQEFAGAKKQKRNLAAAPSCSVSKELPRGLEGVKNVEAEDPHRLWVTLNLFTKHTALKEETLNRTVELLLSFTNYVRYHISCSHAYMHSRMRSRHASLLQVLNRAKTHQTDHVATKID